MPRVLIPSAEQLVAAWQRCKRRTWPATFDAAMADPLYSRLVNMTALQTMLRDARAAKRAQLQAAQPSPHRTPWPPRRPSATTSPLPSAPDRKRLAAGDTDDDD